VSRALPVLALLLVAFAAGDAHACSVCFSTTEENRWAFIGTTVFMSVLPVGILVAIGAWLRRKVLEMERRADAVRAPVPLGADAARASLPPRA